MHRLFFTLKRAFHGTLRITRDPLQRMGLTAARFDLLFAVKEYRGAIEQCRLRRLLGVSRTTVSRMLTSLEELGLVTREVCEADRRTRIVKLTTRGRWRIAIAHRELVRSGWVQLAIDSALGAEGQRYAWYDAAACDEATELLEELLRAFRKAYGDQAALCYPWAPRATLEATAPGSRSSPRPPRRPDRRSPSPP